MDLDILAEIVKGMVALVLGFIGGLFQGRLKERRDARIGAELEAIKSARQAIERFESLIGLLDISDADTLAALRQKNGGVLPITEMQELNVYLTIVERIMIRDAKSRMAPTKRRAILQTGKVKADLALFHLLVGSAEESLRTWIDRALPDDAQPSAVAARRIAVTALEDPERAKTEQVRSLGRLRVSLLTVEYAIRHAVPWSDLERHLPDHDDLEIGWDSGTARRAH